MLGKFGDCLKTNNLIGEFNMIEYKIDVYDDYRGVYQVHTFVDGVEVCDTLKLRGEDRAISFKSQLENGDNDRANYAQKRIYEPYLQRKMVEDIKKFINGEICAGQFERRKHEIKKALTYAYGGIPDQNAIDGFDSRANDSKKDKIAYTKTIFTGKVHPLQQELIDKWVNGEIDGERLILQWNGMLHRISQSFAG